MKILVIRFSSIGDIVLTSAVIRCLKQQLKDSEIHALTKPQFDSLFRENPWISQVHVLGHFAETINRLRAEKFDYVVDLHHNLRSWRVRFALGVGGSSFPKLNINKYLLVRFKLNLMPDVHIVDRYFMAVRSLGVVNDGKGLDFFIPPADRLQLADLPAFLHKGYFAFVIGGNHFTKILPASKVIAVIKQLDLPVVLLGGKEDMQRAEEIEAAIGNHVWNSCGRLRLGQSAWMIEHARAVISNDTGLMHIAAAFRKPVVSVWGNTVPSLGMYPYIVSNPERVAIVEIKNLGCRPCSKIGFPACPKGHFNCMEQIDPKAIAESVRQVTGRG